MSVEILEDYQLRRHLHKYNYKNPADKNLTDKCSSRGRSLTNLLQRVKGMAHIKSEGATPCHDLSSEMQDDMYTFKTDVRTFVTEESTESNLIKTLRAGFTGKVVNRDLVDKTMNLLMLMIDQSCMMYDIPNFDFEISYLELDVLSQNDPMAFLQCLALMRFAKVTVDKFLNTTCELCGCSCVRSNPLRMHHASFVTQLAVNFESLFSSRCNDHVAGPYLKVAFSEAYSIDLSNGEVMKIDQDIEKLIKTDEDFKVSNLDSTTQTEDKVKDMPKPIPKFPDPYKLTNAELTKYVVDVKSIKNIRRLIADIGKSPSKDTSTGNVFKWVEYFAKLKTLGLILNLMHSEFEKPPDCKQFTANDFCINPVVNVLEQTPAMKIAVVFCLSEENWERCMDIRCHACDKLIVLKPETTMERLFQKPKLFVECIHRQCCSACFIALCEGKGAPPNSNLVLKVDTSKLAFQNYPSYIQSDLWRVFNAGYSGRIFLKGRESYLESYFKDKRKACSFYIDPFLSMLVLEYLFLGFGTYESAKIMHCKLCGKLVHQLFGGLSFSLETCLNPFINSLCYEDTIKNIDKLCSLKDVDSIRKWVIQEQATKGISSSDES